MNKDFSQTKILVQKNFWSKKCLIKKIKVQKIFYPIKIGSIKFGSKTIKGLKKSRSKLHIDNVMQIVIIFLCKV